MAGIVTHNGLTLVSPDGLSEKVVTIDNSGNPMFDGAQLAKQTDVGVANSALVKTALNSAGSAPIYACRAWVNFNGTGTVAINGSGNVSSITDNGTGDYTVNYTTAMADANYGVATVYNFLNTGIINNLQRRIGVREIAAGYVRVGTGLISASAETIYDAENVSLAVYR